MSEAKHQVSNEMAVLTVARLLYRIEEANPEVGMGPWKSSFVDPAIAMLGLKKVDVDIDQVRKAL